MTSYIKRFFLAIIISLGIVLPFLYIFVNYITLSLIWNYFYSISFVLFIAAVLSITCHYLIARRYYFVPMMKPAQRYEKRKDVEKAYKAGQNFPAAMSLMGTSLFIFSMILISFFLKYKYSSISYARLLLSFMAVAITAFFIFLFEYILFNRMMQDYYCILINKYDFFLDIQRETSHYDRFAFKKTMALILSMIIIFFSFVAIVYSNLECSRYGKIMISSFNRPYIDKCIENYKSGDANLFRDEMPFDIIIIDPVGKNIIKSSAFIDDAEEKRIAYIVQTRKTELDGLLFIEDANDRQFYLLKDMGESCMIFRFDMSRFTGIFSKARHKYIILAYAVILLIIAGFFISSSYGDSLSVLHDKIEAFNRGNSPKITDVISHTEFRALDYQINMMVFRYNDIFEKFRKIDELILSINSMVKDKLHNIGLHINSAKSLLERLGFESGTLNNDMDKNMELSSELKKSGNNIQSKLEDFHPLITKLSGDITNINTIIEKDSSLFEKFYDELTNMHEIIGNLFQISSDSSSGLSELDASIKHIQIITNEIRELAQSTFNSSENGELIIDKTKNAFYQINNHFSNITYLIENLGDKTNNIDFIIEVIHEIAKKTNLLSLNASIIASQSGEYGKSFLIVANEIHSLAEKTTVSIKDIEKMVGSIKDNVESITNALNLGRSTLENGLKLIENAGNNLRIIVDKARTTLDQISIIYKSITEQSDSTHMINDNSQTIYDELRNINEYVETIKERFSDALKNKNELKEQNSSVTRVFSKMSGNLLMFESDLKNLTEKIKKLNSALSSAIPEARTQGSAFDNLSSIYERDNKIVAEIEVLISEIQKIGNALKDDLKTLK